MPEIFVNFRPELGPNPTRTQIRPEPKPDRKSLARLTTLVCINHTKFTSADCTRLFVYNAATEI